MNIEHLRELESTGEYLFHGSGGKIESILEPRQAYTLNKENIRVRDGNPGVHATPILDIAIFMATVNRKNAPTPKFHSKFDNDNGEINLALSKDTAEQITDESSGYVYVLNKKDFEKRSSIEYISYDAIKPNEIVEVKYSDISIPVRVFDVNVIQPLDPTPPHYF